VAALAAICRDLKTVIPLPAICLHVGGGASIRCDLLGADILTLRYFYGFGLYQQ
jgi:hypothetical protein